MTADGSTEESRLPEPARSASGLRVPSATVRPARTQSALNVVRVSVSLGLGSRMSSGRLTARPLPPQPHAGPPYRGTVVAAGSPESRPQAPQHQVSGRRPPQRDVRAVEDLAAVCSTGTSGPPEGAGQPGLQTGLLSGHAQVEPRKPRIPGSPEPRRKPEPPGSRAAFSALGGDATAEGVREGGCAVPAAEAALRGEVRGPRTPAGTEGLGDARMEAVGFAGSGVTGGDVQHSCICLGRVS
ncbi:LOW QUALITY PROTEIN: collagen alpha-1(I) chain-like [Sturnira hondurensis]|uniref:LOW QUALITY PROTEIN: collagen alpha-1(I) chain-like n=1 Tax=Sturnira hondurensis TaxID=192404 RepID=UPI00187A1195|nr:LOW QUALITY PROTEIN: collagen alpha-1(I) chain-like [Sturnira hondurensis]